jgi:polyisoprenoid-binding protein YceI
MTRTEILDTGRRRERATERCARVAGLALLLALAWPAAGSAQELHVDRQAANRVVFTSRSSLSEFQGVTDRIDGSIRLDAPALGPATGSGDTHVYLEVDLASLATGIGLRDRHMRDKYLEVGRFPLATFEGRIVRSEPGPGSTYRVAAQGKLSVHGVSRDRELTCRVEPRATGYRALCDFQILLTDHDIQIPSVMFVKVANQIGLELDFSVGPGAAP